MNLAEKGLREPFGLRKTNLLNFSLDSSECSGANLKCVKIIKFDFNENYPF